MTYTLDIKVLAGSGPVRSFGPARLRERLSYNHGENVRYRAFSKSRRCGATAAFMPAQTGYDAQVLRGGLWSVPRSAPQWQAR